VNTGAPFRSVEEAQERVLHFQRKLHEWNETTRCAHGEPDAVEVARPVRRATARKPPADKAGPAPRRRPYLAKGPILWRARAGGSSTAGAWL
jgi:hypothetical protein